MGLVLVRKIYQNAFLRQLQQPKQRFSTRIQNKTYSRELIRWKPSRDVVPTRE